MGNLQELSSLAVRIRQSPGYTKDVNCMYILTVYYWRAGNADQANAYLGRFNRLYVHNVQISSDLAGYMTAENLRTNVATLVKTYREVLSNVH